MLRLICRHDAALRYAACAADLLPSFHAYADAPMMPIAAARCCASAMLMRCSPLMPPLSIITFVDARR